MLKKATPRRRHDACGRNKWGREGYRGQRFGRARGIETSGQGVGNVDDKNQPRYRALGHTGHTVQHFACMEHTSSSKYTFKL
jgi:hypothetical protein